MPQGSGRASSSEHGQPLRQRYRFGDVELDETLKRLTVAGRPVLTEALPFRLLTVFLRNPQAALDKEDLIQQIWPDGTGDDVKLAKAVSKLRKALGADGRRWIKTEYGKGYRLEVSVLRLPSSEEVARQTLVESHRAALRARTVNDFLMREICPEPGVADHSSKKPMLLGERLHRLSAMAANQFRDSPETEGEVRIELGEKFINILSLRAAESELIRAISIFRGQQRDPTHTLLVESLYALARALATQSRVEEADKAIADAENETATRDEDENPRLRLAAARAKSVFLAMTQQYEASLSQAQLALSLTDELLPGDLSAKFLARRQCIEMLLRIGEYEQARSLVTEILAPPYTAELIDPVAFVKAQVNLARVRHAFNDVSGVEAPLLVARNILIDRLGQDAYPVAQVHEELGRFYLDRDDFEAAFFGFSEAYRILRAEHGEDHQGTRIAALNIALTGLCSGRARIALDRLDADRPWFVRNMGGSQSPVVQAIDFYRARAMLDLEITLGVVDILSSLDQSVVSQSSLSTYWEATLQAERARLLILTGQRRRGVALLSAALGRMERGGSTASETRRYRSLLEVEPR